MLRIKCLQCYSVWSVPRKMQPVGFTVHHSIMGCKDGCCIIKLWLVTLNFCGTKISFSLHSVPAWGVVWMRLVFYASEVMPQPNSPAEIQTRPCWGQFEASCNWYPPISQWFHANMYCVSPKMIFKVLAVEECVLWSLLYGFVSP